ncbi:unnamed protein product [Cylindrotheca closterium]|uniref:Uncharacterized protein n=1 Tax=Cylindrotheca closterium TaxID=2856 RepID=A0AAD2FQW1_9STRA|nr:unnamed protein product [Cylindrotheca closterium]
MCMLMTPTTKRSIDTINVTDDEESLRCRKRQRQSIARNVIFAEQSPRTIEFEKIDCDSKANVWYSKEDFQLFQFERILSVQCLQRVVAGDKTPLDPEVVCFRGLEPYRSEQRREKFLLRRQNHVSTILEEQDRQVAEGVEEPEAFRAIVEAETHNSLKIAQYQALVDQHESGLKKIVQKNKVQTTITSTNDNNNNNNNAPIIEDNSPVLAPSQQTVAIRAA